MKVYQRVDRLMDIRKKVFYPDLCMSFDFIGNSIGKKKEVRLKVIQIYFVSKQIEFRNSSLIIFSSSSFSQIFKATKAKKLMEVVLSPLFQLNKYTLNFEVKLKNVDKWFSSI